MSARRRERYRLDIVRDGGVETPCVECRRLERARWQDTPDQCSVHGCGWQGSHSRSASPTEWSSGAYRITLTAEGRDGRLIRYHHLFIVRPAAGAKPGRILQVAATGTWTAYNTWGGSNHYQGITGPERNQYAPMVSIERPFCRGFVVLPPEAPRVPLEVVDAARDCRRAIRTWNGPMPMVTARNMRRPDGRATTAISSAGPNGPAIAIDLASQHELHFAPEILDGYDCVVFVGHDEYWTWEMRDAVEAYVEEGRQSRRASPETSCGKHGSKTRGGGRSATNIARPRIRSCDGGDSAG